MAKGLLTVLIAPFKLLVKPVEKVFVAPSTAISDTSTVELTSCCDPLNLAILLGVAVVMVREVAVASPILLFDAVIEVKPERVKGIKVDPEPLIDILSTTAYLFLLSKHIV
jgi:5-enolpyruvylshikimate-3-phosphate synthase